MESLDRRRSPTWLTVMRVLFGAVFVLMLADIFASNKPPLLSDSVLSLGTVFLIFVSLWWKRLYVYRFYEALIATVIPVVMFFASWIRHGPYTVFYGVIAAPVLILMLANLYLHRGETSKKE
jgi:Na+/proline symporter